MWIAAKENHLVTSTDVSEPSGGEFSRGLVTSLFQQPSPVTGRLILPQRQRNIYAEFLADSHSCAPLAALSSVIGVPPFQVVSIAELLKLAQQQAEVQESWTRQDEVTSTDPNSTLCWAYMVMQPEHFSPPLLLVGLLTSSRRSGQLQLQDKTGRVACVVSQSVVPPSHPHLCNMDTCQSSASSSVNSCPFVHSWNLNWMVRVDRFQLVVERFVHFDEEHLRRTGNKDLTTCCDFRINVQFSMCDVVNLHKVRKAGRSEGGHVRKRPGKVDDNAHVGPPAKKGVMENSTNQRNRGGETEESKGGKMEEGFQDTADQSSGNLATIGESTTQDEDVHSGPRTSSNLEASVSCSKQQSGQTNLQSGLQQTSSSSDSKGNHHSSAPKTSPKFNTSEEQSGKNNLQSLSQQQCSSSENGGNNQSSAPRTGPNVRTSYSSSKQQRDEKELHSTSLQPSCSDDHGGDSQYSAPRTGANVRTPVSSSKQQRDEEKFQSDSVKPSCRDDHGGNNQNSAPRTGLSVRISASSSKQLRDEDNLQSESLQPSCSSDNRTSHQSSRREKQLQIRHCVSRNFFLVHKDCPVLQQTAERTMTLGFYCSGLFLGDAVVGEESLRLSRGGKADEREGMKADTQEVAVLFTGEAVQWYNMLHEGCVYRFLCLNTADPTVFSPKMASAALRRAVGATNCRTCVVLPTGVTVEQLSEHRKDLCARLDPILTVEDLCKAKSTQQPKLVSFSCYLVSRKDDTKHHNDRSSKPLSNSDNELGLSPIAGHCVQLSVRDLNSPFYTLTIYADFSTVPYPIGMLPGAVLTFRRLEVRVSKKNKIYCHFTSSSSLRVEALAHVGVSRTLVVGPTAPTAEENLQKVPEVHLGHLVSTETGQQVMVKVVCQVVCVKYLYLQYTCSRCGQIFSSGQCQNGTCLSSSSDPGHFTAKASFLVDDGTGTAHVHCRQDVIGGVLGLSDGHWNILKRQAQRKGRLALRQSGWDNSDWVPDAERCDSPVESLLSSLCESSLVRRPVRLYCQVTSTSSRSVTGCAGKDYPVATLEIGGVRYLTHVHPAVHLHCLKLEPAE